jgi:putative transposase
MARPKKKAGDFPEEFLDQLIGGRKTPEEFFGENGLFKQIQAALIERALNAELTHHLGYEAHGDASEVTDNRRNGHTPKTVETESGPVALQIPRDRDGDFAPQLVKKGQRRLEGFDEKVISLYARGMSMREIQGHLREIYGTECSPELISEVTDAVMDEVRAWQNRPLESIYPVIYMDALRVKVRDAGHIVNKAMYLAIGVTLEGKKEPLGLWLAKTEGAKFWLQVVTELKNRGVEDVFIACVDGLKGFPEAIASVFPKTQVQLCIVHMIRHSLSYVSWKDRKQIVGDLRAIYTAANEDAARQALEDFRKKWDGQYPTIAASWERNWQGIVPFLSYPPMIRKAVYTTNAIEAGIRQVRKIIKSKGSFPDDDAALKIIYLALQNAEKKWKMPIREWRQALSHFAILFADRFPQT